MGGGQQDKCPNGSQTVTVPETSQVLQLRAGQSDDASNLLKKEPKTKVRWDESVIDNEHLNKKKTKICCIFHPQQNFEESEEEGEAECKHDTSSSSESDNDENLSFEDRRQARILRRSQQLKRERSHSPNAYEIQPDYSQYRSKYLNPDN